MKKYGFEIEEYFTILDGLVVRFKDGNFQISASRNGVCIAGHSPVMNTEQVNNTMLAIQCCSQIRFDLRHGTYRTENYFAEQGGTTNA